jgi:hypothetical protein
LDVRERREGVGRRERGMEGEGEVDRDRERQSVLCR